METESFLLLQKFIFGPSDVGSYCRRGTKLYILIATFKEMAQPKPSVRLKQISRIISRQKEDDNSTVTSSCLSIIAILIIILITGIIMFVCGIITITSCRESWLPIWLLVRSKFMSLSKYMIWNYLFLDWGTWFTATDHDHILHSQ